MSADLSRSKGKFRSNETIQCHSHGQIGAHGSTDILHKIVHPTSHEDARINGDRKTKEKLGGQCPQMNGIEDSDEKKEETGGDLSKFLLSEENDQREEIAQKT